MQQRTIGRRTMLAGSLAALCATRAAAWSTFLVPRASRLTPPPSDYLPPSDLRTVADIYRRMTAPVRLNGQGPYPFIVDTGANQSVVSEELAAALDLPPRPQVLLNGIAGVQMTPTTAAALEVGGASLPAVFSILPASAIGGPGILGLDRLEGQRLTLDFGGHALRIERSGAGWRESGDLVVRGRRRDGQLFLMDADLAGIPIVAFLDSGAQNTIGNLALREMAIARHPTSPWTRTPIESATGQTIEADFADLPRLRIGGLSLPNWPVAFADLHTFRMWDLVRKPAILIGVDVLSRFESVCLDFGRDEIRFRLPDVQRLSVTWR